MKNLLLFAMLFCMAGTTIAQCPDPEAPIDDVKVIYSNAWLVPGGMHLIICRGFSLHNDVVFQFNQNFNIGSNGTLWINFGDGQTQQIAGGAAVTHVLCRAWSLI